MCLSGEGLVTKSGVHHPNTITHGPQDGSQRVKVAVSCQGSAVTQTDCACSAWISFQDSLLNSLLSCAELGECVFSAPLH